MRITIESTSRLVEANGVTCRVWEGKTEDGWPVRVLIARIAATGSEADTAEVEAQLRAIGSKTGQT